MKQDPAYLRNQSRYLHATHRRRRRRMRAMLFLWSAFSVLRAGAAALDRLVHAGWGYEPKDVGYSLLFLLFGAGVWLFWTLIDKFLLAYVRHTYGPEPHDQ